LQGIVSERHFKQVQNIALFAKSEDNYLVIAVTALAILDILLTILLQFRLPQLTGKLLATTARPRAMENS